LALILNMSKTPNYDSAVKKILDQLVPGERVCVLTGEKWLMTDEEIGWYKKFNVPPSKYSPLTRMCLVNSNFVLFDVWYNYHPETGKPIVSVVHPASGVKVLPDNEWFQKDFSEYGREVELKRAFFEQFYDLVRTVPVPAYYNYVAPENSIAFISLGDQDSYFVIACKSKRTFYGSNAFDVEDTAEVMFSKNVQNSYNVIRSEKIYNCLFVREAYECTDSSFLFDCRNCEHCFGATNKRHAKYLWFNEQLSKEEWEKRRAQVDLSSSSVRIEYEKKFADLVNASVWPENFNLNTDKNAGEYVTDASDIVHGYNVCPGSQSVHYVNHATPVASRDSYICAGIYGSSDCYYGLGFGMCSNVKYSLCVNTNGIDLEYCNSCYDCEHCFACVGLRRKKFCLFNKQYSEEEYWRLVDELKCAMLERGEYGEFPLMNFSSQYWKNSGSVQLYGATEEECRKMGARIFEPGEAGAEGPDANAELIDMSTINDRVSTEELVGRVFFDSVAKRRFSYLKQELELYEKLRLAPPRLHPTRRIQQLYSEMNMPIFMKIPCQKCGKEIVVAKNNNYPVREIYCRSCYLKYLEENN